MNEQTKAMIEQKSTHLETELYQARQDALMARTHIDEARHWIRDILWEADNSPETGEVFREVVRRKCKEALAPATEDESPLAPCPICGQRNASVIVVSTREGRSFYCVQCHYCGTRGPVDDNRDAVATHWAFRVSEDE